MERVQEHQRNALDDLLGDVDFEKANQDQDQDKHKTIGNENDLQNMDLKIPVLTVVPRDATIKSTKQESSAKKGAEQYKQPHLLWTRGTKVSGKWDRVKSWSVSNKGVVGFKLRTED